MEGLDIPKRLLERAVRNDRQLRIRMLSEEAESDIGQQLRTLLNRIEPARPEEKRSIWILAETERVL